VEALAALYINLAEIQINARRTDDSLASALKSVQYDPSAQNIAAYNLLCRFSLTTVMPYTSNAEL
jgi:hypothetical protein